MPASSSADVPVAKSQAGQPLQAQAPDTTVPAASGIAFKEWSMVCGELAAGTTSLILRKGGIAEGRAGFEWKYARFYLFPTHFHEQAAGLKSSPGREAEAVIPPDSPHTLAHFCELVSSHTLTHWETVANLAPWHPWNASVVQERYAYGLAGSLSVAIVRVHRLAQPVTFPNAPSYGGCRSWVNVPSCESPVLGEPVLKDAVHAARLAEIQSILGILH